jgi:Zn-dependent protease
VFALRDPLMILYMAITLVLSLAIHEASHAFTADQLGDPTARRLGRLTLNPLAHLDPMGSLVLVISALAGFGIGWGKPVPVNPSYLRRGFLKSLPNGPLVGMGIVALAGPVSNLLLALIGVHLLSLTPLPFGFVQTFILVNVILAIFNMIPIPPLDGFRVLVALLPTGPAYGLARLETYGPGLLILLVFLAPGVLNGILGFFVRPILHVLGAF